MQDGEATVDLMFSPSLIGCHIISFYLFVCFCLFAFSRGTPSAYGGSQARSLIGAVAASLLHSHSHSYAGSKLNLQPTPQLMAMLDP